MKIRFIISYLVVFFISLKDIYSSDNSSEIDENNTNEENRDVMVKVKG